MNALIYMLVCLVILGRCDGFYLQPHHSCIGTTSVSFTVPHHPPLKRKFPMSTNNMIVIRNSSNDGNQSEIDDTLEDSSLQEQQQVKQKKTPRPSPTGFSYVEEGVYTNIEEEIEAMGGDPSFLVDAPSLTTTATMNSDPPDDASSPLVVPWEWDGVEDSDAYFDE